MRKPLFSLKPLTSLALVALLNGLAAAENPPRGTADTPKPSTESVAFVNYRVSPQARAVSLNEPVRIEFTTMARQIPEIDIAVTVRQAVTLAARNRWRLVGQPMVVESERSKTITVAVALMPREPGTQELPTIPLSWLKDGASAKFGAPIVVAETISVGGERKPLPAEVSGVARVPWGASFADWRERIPGAVANRAADGTPTIRTAQGLELRFANEQLAEAVLPASGLTLEQTQDTFMSRWGAPQMVEAKSMTWIIGWTRIVANEEASGVKMTVMRDNQLAIRDSKETDRKIMSALDGVEPSAPRIDPNEEFKKRLNAPGLTATGAGLR